MLSVTIVRKKLHSCFQEACFVTSSATIKEIDYPEGHNSGVNLQIALSYSD